MTQQKEQINRSTGLLSGEERRRSQRVIIRVPVTLLISDKGAAAKITAHTVAVNIRWCHGCVPAFDRGEHQAGPRKRPDRRKDWLPRYARVPGKHRGIPGASGIHFGFPKLLADHISSCKLEGRRELIAAASADVHSRVFQRAFTRQYSGAVTIQCWRRFLGVQVLVAPASRRRY